MPANEETIWQQRLKVLRSLNLKSVAAEVNRRRFERLKQKVAAPLTRDDRKRLRRAIKLHEEGQLDQLPSDMRADPERMRRTLIALHRILGNNRTWVEGVERIAQVMRATPSTARRGVFDLEEAYLIEIKRRERTGRRGGQGWSQYMFVWPNLKDLALSQGLQGSLFEEPLDEPPAPRGSGHAATAERGRPDGPSGQQAGGAVSSCGRAPSHSGRAPSHSGRAPSHSGRAYSSAGAPAHAGALSSGSHCQTKIHPPPPTGEEEGGNSRGESEPAAAGWGGVRRRLERYGLNDALEATGRARANGWTVAQAMELLDDCEGRPAAGGVRYWNPGQVWWQLCKGAPGSRIGMPPCEDYRRAKAAQDRLWELRRAAEQQARQATAQDDRQHQDGQLEADYGPRLDAMTRAEQVALAGRVSDYLAVLVRRQGVTAAARPTLLRRLAGDSCAPADVENLSGAERDQDAGK